MVLDRTDLPDIAVGVVKVKPGVPAGQVQLALAAALPANVSVLRKEELIEREARFQSCTSAIGPIFAAGPLRALRSAC